MSLLSTDITKPKKLSLKEVKLSPIERRAEPITPIYLEKFPIHIDGKYWTPLIGRIKNSLGLSQEEIEDKRKNATDGDQLYWGLMIETAKINHKKLLQEDGSNPKEVERIRLQREQLNKDI